MCAQISSQKLYIPESKITRHSTFLFSCMSLALSELSSSRRGEGHCTVLPQPQLSSPLSATESRHPMHGVPGPSQSPLHPLATQKSSPTALECLPVHGMGKDLLVPLCVSGDLGRRSSVGILRWSHHTSCLSWESCLDPALDFWCSLRTYSWAWDYSCPQLSTLFGRWLCFKVCCLRPKYLAEF